MKVQLPFVSKLHERMSEERPLMQFIIGPRQVGKTTGLEQFLATYKGKYTYRLVEADLVSNAMWLRQLWEESFNSSDPDDLLAIDEIQKIPNWSETVKSLWDQAKKNKKNVKCIFLGSSSLKIIKGLTESLTGRYEVIYVHQWSLIESEKINKNFDLELYLDKGGYPGSYQFIKSEERFKSYITNSIINNVIEKDILIEHYIKKPSLFKQMAELLASYPAQEVSFNKLLGQLQESGNVDLVKYYLSIYDSTFLFRTISKYTGSAIRTKQSSPKILPACPALVYALAQNSVDVGRIFESIVGCYLLKICDKVFYWRDGDYELDFVIQIKNQIYAIEVKSGKSKHSKSMTKFLEKYPKAIPKWITKENYLKLENEGLNFFTQA